MSAINLDRARELLAAALETQGRDFRYKTNWSDGVPCVNVPWYNGITDRWGPAVKEPAEDDPPWKTGCIVGTAMSLSGVVDMAQHEVGSVYYAFGPYLTDGATRYFADAQVEQDKGKTWGEAFDYAEGQVEWTRREYGD